MFTIMENRKRPRLELINSINSDCNETLQGVATTATPTTSLGTATLATIGGQSFILSNSAASALPANILLSICDDNSDESEEYILDHAMLTAQIKQEHNVATQTINPNQQQPTTLVTSNAVPQYRLINPAAGKPLNSTNLIAAPSASSNSGLLTNSVHLPAGCEIYVIKEVIDNPSKQVLTTDNSAVSNTTTQPKSPLNSNTTIKLEPMSPLPLIRHSTLTNNNNAQNLNSSHATSSFSPNTNNNTSCSSPQDDNAKRSLILEAYKKRDDKRRATHNEVERRRRDKINSWIFKLKEMLPTEITPSSLAGNALINKDNQNSTTTTTTTRLLVQSSSPGANTTRTPPSDSKSQILIKACEYIKSMQDEIKSLRECLTENEHLRLSNQRLQQEINNLRQKQQQHKMLNNNNNNILITTTNTNNLTNNHHHDEDDDDEEDNSNECEITLNSLNSTYANVQLFSPTTATTMTTTTTNQNNHQHHQHLAGLVGLTTNQNVTTATPTNASTVNVTYAKRELIITDYVD
ncbi:uncharacterized protein ACRADG_008795 [Cochliomyia hominivorax]